MEPDYIYDISSLDKAIAYKIQRTARLLRLHLTKFLQEAGTDTTPEQWFILFRLYEQDGQSQGELADKDLQDHPNVTRMLDALEKRNLVVRQADPHDRRKSLVFLTEAGKQLLAQLFPLAIEERKKVLNGLRPQEINLFTDVLRKIEINILSD
ncbi:MAG TPA: MarR family transcriptional regulator [Anaerolineae bacterium]|nr:MarR family transcriptional regulator [Anaerolineae bacterium]